MDYRQEVEELRQRAAEIGFTDTAVSLMERALELADASDDLDLQYDSRIDYIRIMNFSGFADRALTAFAWCAARSREDPGRFPEDELCFSNYLVAYDAVDFPEVPRRKLMAILRDMRGRCLRNGWDGAYYHAAHRVFSAIGESWRAEVFLRRVLDQWRFPCEACRENEAVDHALDLGDNERALHAGRALIDSGKTCEAVPRNTYGSLLVPLLESGDGKLAAAYHRRGMELVGDRRGSAGCLPDHFQYLAIVGRQAAALELFERYARYQLESLVPADRYFFYKEGTWLLRILDGRTESPTLRLRLPESFELHRADDRYELSELRAHFEARALEWARRFDQRNGNSAKEDALHDTEWLDRLPGR